ncbi:MAG: hypothetical protein ABR585_00205 [Gemmatimonadaceae bacterium]
MIRGSLLGLSILGVGGRVLMRVVAHMEGRVPVLTSGTITVLLAGTVAGTFAGLIYYLLHRVVRTRWLVAAGFFVICEIVAWRGVHGLLPRPQLMFMALSLVFLVTFYALARRSEA